jgi:hypothetical protein
VHTLLGPGLRFGYCTTLNSALEAKLDSIMYVSPKSSKRKSAIEGKEN